MTRIELDGMLEKAVAEAIGVPYQAKPRKRASRRKSAAAYRPVRPEHAGRELQHA